MNASSRSPERATLIVILSALLAFGASCSADEDPRPDDADVDLELDVEIGSDSGASDVDHTDTAELSVDDTRDDPAGGDVPGDLPSADAAVDAASDLGLADVAAEPDALEPDTGGRDDVLAFPDAGDVSPDLAARVTATLLGEYTRSAYEARVAALDAESGEVCTPDFEEYGYPFESECETNLDCGDDLVCRNARGIGYPSYCICERDHFCDSDDDCGEGAACIGATESSDTYCGAGLYEVYPLCIRACRPAACRSDDDCGEGSYCVLRLDACSEILGLVCTRPNQATCLVEGCEAGSWCVADASGRWGCVDPLHLSCD